VDVRERVEWIPDRFPAPAGAQEGPGDGIPEIVFTQEVALGEHSLRYVAAVVKDHLRPPGAALVGSQWDDADRELPRGGDHATDVAEKIGFELGAHRSPARCALAKVGAGVKPEPVEVAGLDCLHRRLADAKQLGTLCR
jgi:hypothetical protein